MFPIRRNPSLSGTMILFPIATLLLRSANESNTPLSTNLRVQYEQNGLGWEVDEKTFSHQNTSLVTPFSNIKLYPKKIQMTFRVLPSLSISL